MFYEFEKGENRGEGEEANDLCLWKCSMWKRKGVCVKVEGWCPPQLEKLASTILAISPQP